MVDESWASSHSVHPGMLVGFVKGAITVARLHFFARYPSTCCRSAVVSADV
jgi:hypothetical protein